MQRGEGMFWETNQRILDEKDSLHRTSCDHKTADTAEGARSQKGENVPDLSQDRLNKATMVHFGMAFKQLLIHLLQIRQRCGRND
ncbi:hypothetical protein PAMP_006709 [Pampus punctatissimus]